MPKINVEIISLFFHHTSFFAVNSNNSVTLDVARKKRISRGKLVSCPSKCPCCVVSSSIFNALVISLNQAFLDDGIKGEKKITYCKKLTLKMYANSFGLTVVTCIPTTKLSSRMSPTLKTRQSFPSRSQITAFLLNTTVRVLQC